MSERFAASGRISMRAAVLNSPNGTFDIQNVELDSPQAGEVLVQVKACGMCHSDLHLAESNHGIPLPAVVGHELAGIVQAIGTGVKDFAPGDHVVGSLIRFCGHCDTCADGRTYQCTQPEATMRAPGTAARLSGNGKPITQVFGTAAFAEYALVHENQLVKVPAALPFPQAAMLGCGAITGAGAVLNIAGVRPGETIVVLGIGGVGLNVISGAVLAGASRIIAIDIQPAKAAMATNFGATDFISALDSDIVAAVKLLSPGGAQHVFEVVGLKETSEQAIKMTALGGHIYLIGIPKPGAPIAVDVHADVIRRQLTIHGVHMGATNIKRDIPFYADLYLQGRFNLDGLISQEINLSQINEAYREVKTGLLARSVITSF